MNRKINLFAALAFVLLIIFGCLSALLADNASAKTYIPKTHHACKTGYEQKTVTKRELKGKRPHRHVVKVKVRECVSKPKAKPVTAAAPVTGTAPTTPTTTVRATIDPSYVLTVTTPQAPPIPVTFTYSASTEGSMPDGELTLNIYVPGILSNAGECEANIGGGTTSATCTVTLPAWGQYELITSYDSGVSNVAATGDTDIVDVEPPALQPETVENQWGVTTPTSGPAIAATVQGSSAAVTLTDGNFEGATAVTLTDQLGDQCTATITGTTATCTMNVTGIPASFTIDYPGGPDQATTQTVSPWGINQPQTVTFQWPAEQVEVANPTVTDQSAVVIWNGGNVREASTTYQTWTGNPPSVIDISAGQTVELGAYAQGSLLDDFYALGGIVYTVSPSGPTLVDEQPASSSPDCAAPGSFNYAGQAVGECELTFPSPGVYAVSTAYDSIDPNYPNEAGPSVMVDVS